MSTTVNVFIGSTDETDRIRAADALSISWRRGAVSDARIWAQSLDGSWFPSVFQNVRVEVNGSVAWRGTVDAFKTSKPNHLDTLLVHELSCVGLEKSLNKRILTNANFSRTPVEVNAAGDSLRILGSVNRFELGDAVKVRCDGTMAGGLSASTVYYIRSLSTTTVQLSTTPAGAVVDITSVGSGQHHLFWCAGSIVKRLIPSGEGLAAGTIRNGAGMENFSTEYTTVFDAIEQLASASGYVWYIDPAALLLNFVPIAEFSAPFAIDEVTTADVLAPGISFDTTRERYANRIFGLPDESLRPLSLNTVNGDGVSRAFSVLFPIKSILSISRAGSAQTVGTYGDTTAQWTYDPNTHFIYQNPSETILGVGQSISVQYYGLGTLAREAEDAPEQLSRGLFERAVTTGSTNYADADAASATELANSKPIGIVAEYSTLTPGLRPAQGQTITYPSCGIAATQFAIEAVTATWQENTDFLYRVVAHGGTRIPGFIEAFRAFLGSTASSGSAVGGVSGGGGGTEVGSIREHTVTLSSGALDVQSPSGFVPDTPGKLIFQTIIQDATGGHVPVWGAHYFDAPEIKSLANEETKFIWCSGSDSKWHLFSGSY